MQDPLHLLLEFRAKGLFRLACHGQMKIGDPAVVQHMPEQRRLADAAATRHDREPRMRPRGLADLPQQLGFLCSSVKVHVLAPLQPRGGFRRFKISFFKNNCLENIRFCLVVEYRGFGSEAQEEMSGYSVSLGGGC